MKNKCAKYVLVLSAIFAVTANHSVGSALTVTIEGAIEKVVPEKREIYVLADGKKNEFYFNDKTEIVKAGQTVAFEVLKKSQKVRVTADKIGKRLDPIKVELLD